MRCPCCDWVCDELEVGAAERHALHLRQHMSDAGNYGRAVARSLNPRVVTLNVTQEQFDALVEARKEIIKCRLH